MSTRDMNTDHPGKSGQHTTSRKEFAKKLRQNMTDAETRLWYHLRAGRLAQIKFRRQVPIGPYVADFCSFEHKLIVEVDGGQHDENRKLDQRRTRLLEKDGFRVVRFWNTDVFSNIEGVLFEIGRVIGLKDSE